VVRHADEIGGDMVCMGQIRNTYKIFVGKPEGMRPFGIPRSRREDDISVDLRNIGREILN
jgi:hypothetical protein